MGKIYKSTGNQSTSILLSTFDKTACSVSWMSTFVERMQEVIQIAGGQSELARRASELSGQKITQQLVQYLSNDKAEKPPQGSTLTPVFAKAANVSAFWLATGIPPKLQRVGTSEGDPEAYGTPGGPAPVEPAGTAPVISWVSAGHWQEAFDPFAPGQADEWVDTSSRVSKHAFALRVSGDSMDNPKGEPTFPDGCIIIVEPELRGSIRSGDFVVMRAEDWDEATFKVFVRDAGVALLRPLNPQWHTVQVPPNAVVCGKVIEKVVRKKY